MTGDEEEDYKSIVNQTIEIILDWVKDDPESAEKIFEVLKPYFSNIWGKYERKILPQVEMVIKYEQFFYSKVTLFFKILTNCHN